jgi:hypothetical protein
MLNSPLAFKADHWADALIQHGSKISGEKIKKFTIETIGFDNLVINSATAKKDLQVLVAQRKNTVIIGHNLAVNVGNPLVDNIIDPVAFILPGKDFEMNPVIISSKTEITKLVKNEIFYVPGTNRLQAAAKESPASFKELELKPKENIDGEPNPKYDASIEEDQSMYVTNIQFIPPSVACELYTKLDSESIEHDASKVAPIIYNSAEAQATVDSFANLGLDASTTTSPTTFVDVLTDQILAFLWIVGDKDDEPPIWKSAGPTASKGIKTDPMVLFGINQNSNKKPYTVDSDNESEDEDARPSKRQTTNHLSNDDIIAIIKASATTASNSSTPNKNYDKLPEPVKDILCRLNTPPNQPLSTIPTEAARAFTTVRLSMPVPYISTTFLPARTSKESFPTETAATSRAVD